VRHINVLESASSGVYNWSDAIPMHVKGHSGSTYFLSWDIHTAGTTINFAWSGSTRPVGSFIYSGASIISKDQTPLGGAAGDGRSFGSINLPPYPFVKIGATAAGTTATISATLLIN
jgi:hypothetical protein